jgi:hypothetical protein
MTAADKENTRRRKLLQRSTSIEDDQILNFREWCALISFSARTGRRVLDSNDGPIVTWLSAGRFGVSVGNNRAWQKSREAPAVSGKRRG